MSNLQEELLAMRPMLEFTLKTMESKGDTHTDLYHKTKQALALMDDPVEFQRRLKILAPDGVVRFAPDAAEFLRKAMKER